MTSERVEIRLDGERKRRLNAIARQRGLPVAAVVRDMIDVLYEDARRDERFAAARRIIASAIEHVPEPAELSRELDERRGRYEDLR